MRTINYRVLLILVGCVAVLAPAIYLLNGYQVKQQSNVYLQHAKQAEEAGKLPEAIGHLSRYLGAAPNDNDALAQMGRLLAETGQWKEAFNVLEQVLRRDPTRTNARRSLAQASLALQRYDDAIEQLELIIANSEDDTETHLLFAACHAAYDDWRKAEAACLTAIEKDPSNIIAYQQLMILQRNRLDDAVAAERTVDLAVSTNPDDVAARILRGAWRLQYRNDAATVAAVSGADSQLGSGSQEVLAQAHADAAKAMQQEPDNVDAVRLAASVRLAEGNFEAARELADKAIEMSPLTSEVYGLRAQVASVSGNPKEASNWLKKAVEVSGNDPALLSAFASSLIDLGEVAAAEEALGSLQNARYEVPRLRLLEAQLAIAKQQWREGATLLDECIPLLVGSPELAKQAHFLQASCYRQLQRPDLQIDALKRSIAIDPSWSPPREEMAAALNKLGRRDEASDHLRQIGQGNVSEDAKAIRQLRDLVARTASTSADRQDWVSVQREIDRQIATEDAAPLRILKAHAYLRQGDSALADEVLDAARQSFPKNQQVWTSSILVSAQYSPWEQTETLLAGAIEQLGDPLPLRLVHAQVVANQFQMEGREKLLALAVPPEKYDTDEKLKLLAGIGQIFGRMGGISEAQQLLGSAGKMAPGNLQIRLSLFELAFKENDLDAMESALNEVQAIDGKGPYWKYGEGLRLAIQASQNNDAALFAEAETLLLEAKQRLSNLRQIPLFLARLNDSQKKWDQAATYYLEAFDAGEREPTVLERMLAILLEQQQNQELQRVLDKLQKEDIKLTDGMQRAVAENNFRRGRLKEAIEQGRRLIGDEPRFKDLLWLGTVLAQDGQLEEAERHFRQATQLAPDEPAPWVARIKLAEARNQKEQLENIAKEADQGIDSLPVSIAITQAYWSLEGPESAKARFAKLIDDNPNNADALQAVVQFYLQTGQGDEAKTLLQQFVRLESSTDDQQRWAQRNLAIIAARGGDALAIEEAISLMERNLQDRQDEADQITMARIFASSNDPEMRRKAIALLAAMEDRSSLATRDRFLLANLYYSNSDFDEADSIMRSLIASFPENAVFLRRYVETLVQQKQLAEASIWLGRLKKTAPLDIATIDLEALVHLERGNFDELAESLVSFATVVQQASNSDSSNRRQFAVAAMIDRYIARLRRKDANSSQIDTLKRVSNRLWSESTNRSLLALQSARRGDIDDAIDWIQAPPEDATSEQLAAIGSMVVASGLATQEQLERLGTNMASQIDSYPQAMEIVLVLAELQGRLGQLDAAIANYRKVLKSEEDNILALNNLAALLALSDASPSEALERINQAIAAEGVNGTFLDTRAMIHIAGQRYDDAVADLTEAIDYQATPVKYFHLALAHHKMNSKASASQAWQEATKRGIAPTDIHPLEMEDFQQLQQVFGTN